MGSQNGVNFVHSFATTSMLESHSYSVLRKPSGKKSNMIHKNSGSSNNIIRMNSAISSSIDEDNDTTKYENPNNIDDQVFSAISGDGGIKVTVATLRNLVNELMIQHNMFATPGDALGRLVTCSILMANGMQDEQQLQITINADGPLRGAVSVITGGGRFVKGYVGSPQLGNMPLPEAIGTKGAVQVVKNHPSWPNPYNGITAVEYGDMDRDIGQYLAESEQKSCALAAATTFNEILCTSAGGYLVEQLPGVEDETIAQIEKNLAALVELNEKDQKELQNNNKMPANLLLQGKTPVDIAQIILKDLDMKPLGQLSSPPVLKCQCTNERLLRALRLLPKEEVDDLLEKEEKIEAQCTFCRKVYRMEANEVREHFADKAGQDPSIENL